MSPQAGAGPESPGQPLSVADRRDREQSAVAEGEERSTSVALSPGQLRGTAGRHRRRAREDHWGTNTRGDRWGVRLSGGTPRFKNRPRGERGHGERLIDQDTDRGRHVWRLAKSGTFGFSFSYMTHDSIRRADGVRKIRELDVFEISATATPMNGATRVLSTKSADAEHDVRAKARELMLELLLAPVEGGTPDTPAAQTKPVAPPITIATFEV